MRVVVGRLGALILVPGFYVYVGSALGSGGVAARIARHRKVTAVRHWHIDYVRPSTLLESVWYTYDSVRREHEWAHVLQQLAGAHVPCPRFGASDCRCDAHLFYFGSAPALARFRKHVSTRFPAHPAIYRLSCREPVTDPICARSRRCTGLP
jgi:Uri superfamily endonuclease